MEFPKPDLSLKPEMFTNITMSVSIGRQVLVPQDALMDTGSEQYVFIDKGDGYAQPRKVKVSAEAGENVGIEQRFEAWRTSGNGRQSRCGFGKPTKGTIRCNGLAFSGAGG